MALLYVLDGYNIIKSGAIKEFESKTLETQRKMLVDLINERHFKGSGNNKVKIVFDGTYEMSLLHSQYLKAAEGVEVYFSSGETADEKIEELVLSHLNPSEVIVVSNDKGLRRRIGGKGVRYMSVEGFAGKITLKQESRSMRMAENGHDDITDEMKREWLK